MSISTIRSFLDNRNITSVMMTQILTMFTAWLWWPYRSLFILELGANKETLGALLMIETIGGMIFQLPGGILADRIGRKKVMLLSSIIGLGSPIIYLFATNWVHIAPALVLASTSSLSRPAYNALIAESLPPDKRSSGFAAISFVQKIPNIFTGLIGGYIIDVYGVLNGVRLILVFSLLASSIGTLIYWRRLEETLTSEISKPLQGRRLTLQGIGSMPRNILILTIVAALSAFGVRMLFGFTVIYAVEEIGLSTTQYGLISTIVSLTSLFLTMPGGLIADRIGKKKTVTISRFVGSLSTVGVPLSSSFMHLAFFSVAGSIGSGMGGTYFRVRGGPVWEALVADMCPMGDRARLMGLMGTIISLINIPATWVGGYLYDNSSPSLPFLTSFALNTFGTLLLVFLVREDQTAEENN
jgi:MFS family permease